MRRYTIFQNVLEKLTILLLLATLVWIIVCYGDLPERIPTHFDLHGNADGYGKKTSIWFIYAMGVVFTLMLLLLSRFMPMTRNTINIPWPVTERAWPYIVTLTINLLLWTALQCAAMFMIPVIWLVYGNGSGISIWILCGTVLATCVYYIVKMRKVCLYNNY